MPTKAKQRSLVSRRDRLFAVINSPFVIWLLSAVLLASLGFHFTTSQQCYREADRTREQLERLDSEIETRRTHIAQAAALATSRADLRRSVSSFSYTYLEYKDKSGRELWRELQRARSLIFGTIPARWQDPSKPQMPDIDTQTRGVFDQLLLGYLSPKLKEEDLPSLKAYIVYLISRDDFERYDVLTPRCGSPFVLWEFAFTGRAKILWADAEFGAGYDGGIFGGDFNENEASPTSN